MEYGIISALVLILDDPEYTVHPVNVVDVFPVYLITP